MYIVRHTPSAEECYRGLTPAQRRRIIFIINTYLASDPAPDHVRKVPFSELGPPYVLYLDPRDPDSHWVLYVYRGGSIEILVVGVGVRGPNAPVADS